MKKRLLSLAIISLISTATFAQFKFGVKGGASMNKLTGQSFKDQFTFGYHVGGFAEIGLGKKFAIQPEVLFNQVNLDTSSKFSSIYQFNQINDVQLKYLSIPIMLNYRLSNIVSLQAGPQFGVLIDQNKNLLQNGKDAFKNGDFSMAGGLQVKLAMLRLYGRYSIGLNNLNNIGNQDEWKSQSIQLGVGLAL